MKKTGLIVCIVTMIAMLVLGTAMMATAEEGGLTLVETYPEDGQKNAAVENLGIKLDPIKNKVRGQETVINSEDSKVALLLIPTNEELMIARDTFNLATK